MLVIAGGVILGLLGFAFLSSDLGKEVISFLLIIAAVVAVFGLVWYLRSNA